jgi:hypothetical protein
MGRKIGRLADVTLLRLNRPLARVGGLGR